MSDKERVEALRAAAPNTWVALASDESAVVATGDSYEQAVTAAEDAGETDPVLIKTPENWGAMIL